MTGFFASNQLIDSLTAVERESFLDRCEPFELVPGAVLDEAGKLMLHAIFPLEGFISLLVEMDGHPPMKLGQIGCEGMLGVTLMLAVEEAPLRAVVQSPGTALRMSAAELQLCCRDYPSLLPILGRYLFVLFTQLSLTAGCNHFHKVNSRLALCLLETHDRSHFNNFHFTHQFLADLLGVQRSAVTIAAGDLQEKHLISYSRGEITVLDRKGLEAEACGCYDRMASDYRLMLP